MASKPVYESMMDKIIRKIKAVGGMEKQNTSLHKVVCSVGVDMGSSIDGALIKDINFTHDSLVVSILRGDEEIIPKGDTVVKAGDIIFVLTNEKDKIKVQKKLNRMAGFKVR